MTDESQGYDRRSVLQGTAAAGVGSFAGCSMFSDESQNKESQGSKEPVRDAPRWVGPLASRPETGNQAGHEYFVDRGPQQGALYIWQGEEWKQMSEFAASGVRFAVQHANAGRGTPDDPWVLDADALPEGGTVYFEPGNYVSPGMSTVPDVDYEQTAVYLEGAGVRTTTLTDDATDGSLISFRSDESGNFGGVSDMSVLGHYPDENERSKGHLIHGTGKIIDTLYENLIVRYSWGDGLRLEASTSGTRLRNSWIENNFGWNVYLGGGTRLKLSNLHIVSGKEGGIYLRPSYSQVSNVSIVNCSPGLELTGANNSVSNVYVTNARDGPAIRDRLLGDRLSSHGRLARTAQRGRRGGPDFGSAQRAVERRLPRRQRVEAGRRQRGRNGARFRSWGHALVPARRWTADAAQPAGNERR